MAYVPLPSGTTNLVGGSSTITDPLIKTTSKVLVANNAVGGTLGLLSVALNNGVGFTITSANALDTSTIRYIIIY